METAYLISGTLAFVSAAVVIARVIFFQLNGLKSVFDIIDEYLKEKRSPLFIFCMIMVGFLMLPISSLLLPGLFITFCLSLGLSFFAMGLRLQEPFSEVASINILITSLFGSLPIFITTVVWEYWRNPEGIAKNCIESKIRNLIGGLAGVLMFVSLFVWGTHMVVLAFANRHNFLFNTPVASSTWITGTIVAIVFFGITAGEQYFKNRSAKHLVPSTETSSITHSIRKTKE